MSSAKSKPWFRFYHEALDDPKVQRLPHDVFRAWINILCLACRNDGDLPSRDDIAFALRMSDHDGSHAIDRLIDAQLIDIGPDGKLQPHNWAGRQFQSDADPTATERKRRQRERSKVTRDTSQDVTRDTTVTVTRTETETDTETETEKIESAHARKDRVWLNDMGEINFTDSYRDEWINDPDFFDGDAASFRCAVTEARPYVRPNGTPLEAQLSRQLAMRCRDRRERDKRYQSAQQPKQSIVLDAERWAAIERRAAEIGG